jgi:hypothetical protein
MALYKDEKSSKTVIYLETCIEFFVDALNIALKNKYYCFTAVHGSLLDFDAG